MWLGHRANTPRPRDDPVTRRVVDGIKEPRHRRLVDPEALRAAVATNIKARAERQGLSLSALARKAEVGRTHLFAIVWGRRSATTDTLSKLAVALDCEPWHLLKPPRRVT
jgi:ribosome-binding protein aMBF1 (putative translation factor)